uniref:Uncharacterized protein n=1 Tax=Graphocephala atropunctata TaxID=36148 RepID=A0A1B6MCK1_9HEMI
MSGGIEEGDVILISSQTKNQDGSQTFLILDPCPSTEECANEPPGIELIDLTAEVKNTGTIAVLSTNTNTGELEISFTNKTDTISETMDSASDTTVIQLNGTSSTDQKKCESSDEFITDDDLLLGCKIKEEEEDDVDVEEISVNEAHVRNELESVTLVEEDLEECSQQIDNDDDQEEGALYIDDAKSIELQDEPVQENLIQSEENFNEEVDILLEESKLESEKLEHLLVNVGGLVEMPVDERETSDEMAVDERETSNKKAIDERETSDEKAVEERETSDENAVDERETSDDIAVDMTETLETPKAIVNSESEIEDVSEQTVIGFSECVDDRVEINKESNPLTVLVHGQIINLPQESQCPEQKMDDSEYVDSTNTALTLLELAGGTSFRNTIEPVAVEMQLDDLEQDGVPFLTDSGSVPDSQCEIPQSRTLATLQPVPVETLLKPSCPEQASTLEPDQPADTSSAVEQASTSESIQQTRAGLLLGHNIPSNLKSTQEMVQCILVSGDTPRYGTKCIKPQYQHMITSPILTKDEITKEIMERSMQKCPYTSQGGGDVIFAMKLAHRLATRIVSPEKTPCVEAGKVPEEEKGDVSKSDNNTPAVKTPLAKTNDEIPIVIQKKNAISDKYELLKILEDDPDDVSNNEGSTVIDKKSNTNESLVADKKPLKIKDFKSSRSSPLIKLHPELEKELALKQLEGFNNEKDKRKKKVVFGPNYVKKMAKIEPVTPKKHHEHNNNLNSKNPSNLTKRKSNEPPVKSLKRLKTDKANSETVTVDPSQITETLTVEGQELAGDQPKDGKSLKQYSNKRLSRNSETPPREVPMEILLNGVEEVEVSGDEKDTSKNKIFKATNPRKRQEELKRKRQKHFANMLQKNQPLKKRGRPPKKKPDIKPKNEFINEDLLWSKRPRQNLSKSEVDKQPDSKVSVETSSKTEKPVKTKKMREIEQLLGDEGAINMLYSVEQKRTTGSEPKRSMLPSYRRKKKDLQLKTKLVKSAVLRLTVNPPQPTGRVSLRGQAAKDDESEENSEVALRKMSVDSRDSHHSFSSPPNEQFPFPAKIVPAEASRIIRRHSSSSNYSSRSNSPRRLSVDGERVSFASPERQVMEVGQGDVALPSAGRQSKSMKSQQTPEGVMLKKSDKVEKSLKDKCQVQSPPEEHSQETQSVTNKIAGKCKSNSPRLPTGRPRRELVLPPQPWLKKKRAELNSTLAAAVEGFTKKTEANGKTILSGTPKKLASKPIVSNLKTRSSKLATEKVAVYRKTKPVVIPGPARDWTEKPSVVYKEMTLKRHDHLVEIILAPVSTKLRNTLNTNVLKELVAVLKGLALDENCRVVLVTCSGDTFCQGVDFPALVQPAETRMEVAMDLAVTLKDFIKALAMFTKPMVAGVHGPALGLGVTMLPLFDMVLSSQHATFHTPYAALGQIPEGAATLTLPTLLGCALTSELFFASRKLTAAEALRSGLVTRILESDDFHKELLSVVGAVASQSSQAMDATKALLRHNLMASLETTLMSETHLLIQHWASAECQANFTKYLEEDENPLGLQKQPT